MIVAIKHNCRRENPNGIPDNRFDAGVKGIVSFGSGVTLGRVIGGVFVANRRYFCLYAGEFREKMNSSVCLIERKGEYVMEKHPI
mgnify:CR=1 FL=1